MKVLQVFNQYRSLFNGEELVVTRTVKLLRERGIDCELLMPSSRDIVTATQRVKAFFSGIYSFKAEREMRELLNETRPDLVHCHNLRPLLSPSVLVACRKAGVPVVVSIHNQGLTCPTADHLHNGKVCVKCYGGKEHHCVLNNCRGNLIESIGYAARSKVAHQFGLFSKNATLLIALTAYARQWIADSGYDANRIEVLHNFVDQIHHAVDPAQGAYVAFAGRLSAEKDVATLLSAARRLPSVRFRIAGSGPEEDSLREQAPDNVDFVGRVPSESMADFYRGARCLVLPSRAFEMCPLVISEAMSHGVPVVASAIGGLDELVEDGATGYLFEPGNAVELAAKVGAIATDDELAREFGAAGHAKAAKEYAVEAYVGRLLQIYQRAARIVHGELPESFNVGTKALEQVAP